ncbi:hypothetical protein ABZ912_58490 [Nonomuraea angiospora]|uniref:hypothetical protein n=1 Tax=Nonomuraea angiospora TaxID=46172 RepID=UPI0033FB7F16
MIAKDVLACLAGAGLGVSSLVKVTTFLSKREHADANSAIRREILGATSVVYSQTLPYRGPDRP